jgi:glucose/arabinose dehydrogenase
MKLHPGVLLLALAACATSACQRGVASTAQQPPANAPQTRATPAAPQSANQETNDRFAQQIAERIKGREGEPAEQVFKNIQQLKGIPAGRLLLIMNRGYSRALGVSCTHCHVEQDFASDDKRPKRAAREMAVMHRSINEQLAKMQNLEPRQQPRAINCSTCHRGAVNPVAP